MRYSVLTFIIGKGYENVREITSKQDDVEYLLVTDDPDLRSDTWKVVFDEDLLRYGSVFERCFRIRYGVFKYCSTDICVTIDGSMHLKGSLDKLLDEFESGKYDICLMPHPIWSSILTEYGAWIKMRGYPPERAMDNVKFIKSLGYDFGYRGLFQIGFTVKRRSQTTSDLDAAVFGMLREMSASGEFERLDQTVFSYVMNTKFNHLKVLPVSEQVIRSNAVQLYWHGSDRPNVNAFYDIDKPDMKYVFDKLTECYYLK